MNLERQTAVKIPASYRSEILKMNIIAQANLTRGNVKMKYLYTIWREFVEPTISEEPCNLCNNRVLDNYKKLLPLFIEMEKENSLLAKL
jgi:hypothetical protein